MAMNETRLGDNIHRAIKQMNIDQNSQPSEDLGKQMWRVIAAEIIKEIRNNATIAPLSTTSTPAGQGPHIHNPETNETTGKIS